MQQNVEHKIELLAPAKNKETAIAAINAGADAVYIGYLKFGARSAAGNSLEDIKELVGYAHKFKVKIYVTLNTIFNDEEIEQVKDLIADLYNIGVDGIIIQDMGILEFELPPIPIIASTQCNNDSLEKVKFLEKTGFKRVILPREFSIEEIENISKNTKIEIETFVHGALCVSYSGQCYLSYAIGGRSANRGECAQPCRKKYSLKDADGNFIAKDSYLLSLKDFNLSDHLEELIKAGVTSFKIEGRLKDEDYIKNIVSHYRIELDKIIQKNNLERSSIGVSTIDFTPNPSKTFNRGYTNYFLKERNKNISAMQYSKSLGEYIGKVKEVKSDHFTITNNVLNNSDGICFFNSYNELQGTKINKSEGHKVYPNSMFEIKPGIEIYRNYDSKFSNLLASSDLTRKLSVEISVSQKDNQLIFTIMDDEGISANLSINDDFEEAKNKETALKNIQKQLIKLGNTEFEINNIQINLTKIPFLTLSELNSIRRELVEKLQERRKIINTQDYRTEDLQQVEYPYKKLSYKANVYNSKAKLFYEKRGVSEIELAAEDQKSLKNKEVMLTKHCLKYMFGFCSKQKDSKQVKEPLFLVDEFNKEYPLGFNCKECKMTIKY